MTISLHRVSVSVPSPRQGEAPKVLLDDVQLEIDEPRVAVIGANGSGKSTLLRLLNGLREPTSGTVKVRGHDTRAAGERVRSIVGFIFTDPLSQLLMSTPIEDIELSLRRRIKARSERLAKAQQLLDERGIGQVAHQSIYDLSGGERQIVALASVLAVEPRIIVADEPTTLLDLRNKEQLRRIFAELPQQIIYSTHDLEFAADAQRVIVVDGGRIVADDAPAAAIAHYRRLMA